MLGNPNTPQGERSLEDTEKESEEEGASVGAGEEVGMRVVFKRVAMGWWGSGFRAGWWCPTGLCPRKFFPSSCPRDGKQPSWNLGLKYWPLMVMFSDRLRSEEQVCCVPFCHLCSRVPEPQAGLWGRCFACLRCGGCCLSAGPALASFSPLPSVLSASSSLLSLSLWLDGTSPLLARLSWRRRSPHLAARSLGG